LHHLLVLLLLLLQEACQACKGGRHLGSTIGRLLLHLLLCLLLLGGQGRNARGLLRLLHLLRGRGQGCSSCWLWHNSAKVGENHRRCCT
jgi:hypothetical protein